MIHEIAIEVAAILASKGVPFDVLDGPEDTTTATWGRERIVINHAPDTFGPVLSQRANPRQRRTVHANYKATIYAQEPVSGAQPFEHRRRCELARDMFLIAMDYVASARRNAWLPTSGQFVDPPDLDASEVNGGAVYELAFTFDRGVADVTWAGAAKTEFSLIAGTVHSTTKAFSTGDVNNATDTTTAPVGAETSCGP